MSRETLDVYTDFKSPYAYLAVEPTRALERDYDIELRWLPYTLNIPEFLGSARLGEAGNVIESNRSERQWKRVRYAYMDVRRYANLRGLTVRGPQKIWDSSIAAIGLLYADSAGSLAPYMDAVFERFWKRELDLEDPTVVEGILAETGTAAKGIETEGFASFLEGEGRSRHDEIRSQAEDRGVFGVPTFCAFDELFFGREHLPLIRLRLQERGLAKPGVEPPDPLSYAYR